MNSFRVHSTDRPYGLARFLLIGSSAAGHLTMDFDGLEARTEPPVPRLTLSEEAILDLLEGQDLHIERTEGSVTLVPRGEDLIVVCDGVPGRDSRTYRLPLLEVALGWNLLRGSDRLAGVN